MHLAQLTLDKQDFANWLIDIGHGRNIDSDGTIMFDLDMCIPNSNALINYIYLNIDQVVPLPLYFLNHIILTPRNSDVDNLNAAILNCFPRPESSFYSTDSIKTESGVISEPKYIPTEFLHSINASGLPPRKLHLKPSCPLILL